MGRKIQTRQIPSHMRFGLEEKRRPVVGTWQEHVGDRSTVSRATILGLFPGDPWMRNPQWASLGF